MSYFDFKIWQRVHWL